MLIPGSKERKGDEYREIDDRAGFDLARSADGYRSERDQRLPPQVKHRCECGSRSVRSSGEEVFCNEQSVSGKKSTTEFYRNRFRVARVLRGS